MGRAKGGGWLAQGGIRDGSRDYSWLSLDPRRVRGRICVFGLVARHRQQRMRIVAVQRSERSGLPRCPARLSEHSRKVEVLARMSRSGARRWLRRLRAASLTVVVLILLSAIVGTFYQALARRRDAQRFPPRGKFVDVGGHKLNLNCTGQGTPTVILETGLGVLAVDWQLVQPEIAKFTRGARMTAPVMAGAIPARCLERVCKAPENYTH